MDLDKSCVWGELSRIGLAIQVIGSGSKSNCHEWIFELKVDSASVAQTASIVGQLLRKLARYLRFFWVWLT